jgi:hypothetical protein
MIGSNLTYEGLENLEQIKIARTAAQVRMIARGRSIVDDLVRQGQRTPPSFRRITPPKPITPAPPAGSVPLDPTSFKPLREIPPIPKLPTGMTTANRPPPSTAQKVRDIAEEASDTVNQAHFKFMTEYPRTYGAFQGTVQGMGGMTPGVSGGVLGAIGGAIEAVPTSSRAVNTLGSMFTSVARSV